MPVTNRSSQFGQDSIKKRGLLINTLCLEVAKAFHWEKAYWISVTQNCVKNLCQIGKIHLSTQQPQIPTVSKLINHSGTLVFGQFLWETKSHQLHLNNKLMTQTNEAGSEGEQEF